jgi:pimeloyl-ACP methyl ester carboxylesterase
MRLHRFLAGACAILVALAIAWLGGTFWIRAREPVMTSALPASFPGRVIQAGGHGVRILERGAGPAVLLVAGTGGSVASWPASVLERLAVDHYVIAVDLYGMGFSERSGDFTYGSALWSQQLVSVLDALGIERASVVGHSLGGTVATFFAANHPDRVDRVVFAGSAISIPWWFPVFMVPGPGELFLASQEVFGPTFSPEHRAQAIAAYRIRGTRVALLRYVRHSLLEARELSPAVAAVRAKVLRVGGGDFSGCGLRPCEQPCPSRVVVASLATAARRPSVRLTPRTDDAIRSRRSVRDGNRAPSARGLASQDQLRTLSQLCR